MKVLGINGSPRKNGNTSAMIQTVFQELESEGIATMQNLGRNMAWLLKKIAG
jgi:multimeric flavodoxin WrbA